VASNRASCRLRTGRCSATRLRHDLCSFTPLTPSPRWTRLAGRAEMQPFTRIHGQPIRTTTPSSIRAERRASARPCGGFSGTLRRLVSIAGIAQRPPHRSGAGSPGVRFPRIPGSAPEHRGAAPLWGNHPTWRMMPLLRNQAGCLRMAGLAEHARSADRRQLGGLVAAAQRATTSATRNGGISRQSFTWWSTIHGPA